MALKSGSNAFHGSLYDYYRSKLWEARNFFNPTNTIPSRVRHQLGATLGGPILRDRSFFFFSFSGLREHASRTLTTLVPSEAMRNGDFSALSGPIVDPMTATEANNFAMRPFPGNRIPLERFNPATRQLLAVYPAPNLPSPSRNYFANLRDNSANKQWIGRIDHELSSKDRLSGHFNIVNGNTFRPGQVAPTFGASVNEFGQRTALLRYTRLFAPTVLNEFSVGFSRNRNLQRPQDTTNWLSKLGITGVPQAGEFEARGMLDIYMPPYLQMRDFGPTVALTNNYSLTDNFNWHRRAHSLKAGLDIRRNQLNDFSRNYQRGEWIFNPWPAGDPFANFLLGVPGATWASTPRDFAYMRKWDTGYYIQDDWKVTPWLTLNLGLRYERFTNPVEKYDRISTLDPATGGVVVASKDGRLPARGIEQVYFSQLNVPLVTSTQAGFPRSLARTDTNNFAPRFGFALRPFGGTSTVVRGGYGIYYYPMRQFLLLLGASSPPFVVSLSSSSNAGDWVSFEHPFEKSRREDPATTFWALSPDYKDGYYQNWNLTIERKLGFDTALRLSYVGNKGTNLNQSMDVNYSVPRPDGRGGVTLVRRFPQFFQVRLQQPVATAIYNGLELEVKKRYSHGLSFDANWTWGKAISVADLDNWEPESIYLSRERARSNFVPAHQLNFNSVYALPFGQKGRFLRNSGWLDHVVGGWNIAGLSKFRSGLWFSPNFSHAFLPAGGSLSFRRPDLVGDPNKGPRTAEKWFDPLAFRGVPAGEARFGTSGRSVIEGPGLASVDFAVYKSFRVRERQSLNLRVEIFNLINHTNLDLGAFNQDVTFPVRAGVIFNTATPARQFQFALRYDF